VHILLKNVAVAVTSASVIACSMIGVLLLGEPHPLSIGPLNSVAVGILLIAIAAVSLAVFLRLTGKNR